MHRLPLLAAALALAASARDRIAYIEFYGYQGLDLAAIRKALPVHEGDALTDDTPDRIEAALKRLTGRNPDIGGTCCVGDGDTFLTIGLRAARASFRASPMEDITVPKEGGALYKAMTDAEEAAFAKGMYAEDGNPGYRRSTDPSARAAQLKVRDYALRHEADLLPVLKSADSADQRQIACDILGYGRPTAKRNAALVEAAGDPDATVRNNAARALWEMLRADPSSAAHIQPDPFIYMIRAGSASDLNKSTLVLEQLTHSRNPQLLARLKTEAWDALMEFATWRVNGWASSPRIILARIAGVPEERAQALASGPVADFLQAVNR